MAFPTAIVVDSGATESDAGSWRVAYNEEVSGPPSPSISFTDLELVLDYAIRQFDGNEFRAKVLTEFSGTLCVETPSEKPRGTRFLLGFSSRYFHFATSRIISDSTAKSANTSSGIAPPGESSTSYPGFEER